MNPEPFLLQYTMRWFGTADPVKLEYIKQAGCTGVVSALHAIPIGEVWEVDAILQHKKIINNAGLEWVAVESLPVHEDIKTSSGRFIQYIQNYKASIQNLGLCEIKIIIYNFMPVLDWLRTDVDYRLENNSSTLRFNWKEYAVFDLFILKRKNAENDYSKNEIDQLSVYFRNMSASDIARVTQCMLLALPGSDESFTLEKVRILLSQYDSIDEVQLQQNLIYFLRAIIPTATKANIRMAIHPDDPPYSVFGLPRIMSTLEHISQIMSAVPDSANGLCFCTGSLGARLDNNLVHIIRKYSNRISFLHLRNTKRSSGRDFAEASHLDGDTDMFEVVRELIYLMKKEKRSIPMRPDHGYKMLDDLSKSCYPGYSAIGRLKGIAEIRGLELGIRNSCL